MKLAKLLGFVVMAGVGWEGALGQLCGQGSPPSSTPAPPPSNAVPASPSFTPPLTPSLLSNISTRGKILGGDQVLIGGVIIGGRQPKQILFRALGPTLAAFGVAGALADPILELHGSDANGHDIVIATNDNWKDTQEASIAATGKAPPQDLESAILQTVSPGNYTVILRGKSDGTGVALIEAYDVSSNVAAPLGNISTRGFVDIGENALIGGFILAPSSGASSTVVARALGPTLAGLGVSNALADPILELHDSNGTIIATNDDWQSDGEASQIVSSRHPGNTRESALHRTLVAGSYTAVVRGKNNGTGVALVEIYYLP